MYVYEYVGYVRCTACYPESVDSAGGARLGIFTHLICRVTWAVCSSLEFSKWRSAIDSRFQQLHLHLSLFYIPLLPILSTFIHPHPTRRHVSWTIDHLVRQDEVRRLGFEQRHQLAREGAGIEEGEFGRRISGGLRATAGATALVTGTTKVVLMSARL